MAFDSADALAKTYARNKKLLSLRSITNGLQQTGLPLALGETSRALHMSASGTKRTWTSASHMSAFGGVKRTSVF